MKNTQKKQQPTQEHNQQQQNKRAIFVVGPESSGTRMMTKAFIACGAYGDGTHAQRLDNEGFGGGHQLIVLRRSVPHGTNMPKIHKTIQKLWKENYQVIPIVILRDKDKCAKSQVKNKHADTMQKAKDSIKRAIAHIYGQLSNFDGPIHIMHYEPFVKMKKVRDNFFKKFGFEHPEMEFYNANLKYK